MDWITTSGKTLDEAKSHALDQLGIVADEAEFDVVNDVEKGLFGRVKTEAKIRARVRPKQPSTTDDRGNRRRSGGGGNRNRGRGKGGNKGNQNKGGQNNNRSNGGNNRSGGDDRASENQSGQRSSEGRENDKQNSGRNRNAGGRNKQNSGGNSNSQNNNSGNGGRSNKAAAAGAGVAAGAAASNQKKKKDTVETEIEMSRPEQEQTAHDFLEGVLGAFGMTGTVAIAEEPADDGAIEMAVSGEELGLLVGQKGLTLNALQELTRTVVQRKADGAKTSRLRVDVAGYRARRTLALQDFSRKIAADVVESGTEKLMEPMGPADRKVVHDTVNDIDGVETGSEGEEPRRRVVIRPV